MRPNNSDTPGLQDFYDYVQQHQLSFSRNAAIAPFLTMGIGGTVPLLITITQENHLKNILALLFRAQARFILLGGGSNVVFPDAFVDPDFIVLINRTNHMQKIDQQLIQVSSGVLNSQLMAWNIENGIGGMDFLAGIPGTIGGAAAVNGGAFGEAISSLITHAEIFDAQGHIKTVDNSYFQFQYRDSFFKHNNETIIHLFLAYTPEESATVRQKVTARLLYRKENHPPMNLHSAGCFFKNPIINGQKISAGKIIEQTGLKGQTFNTLRIADAHANFIVNDGTASFADIQQLENHIKHQVLEKQGITLEREVIYISPTGEKY